MGHDHDHKIKGKNLFWTIVLNLSITIAEGIGGLLSGSMALLSDALHNFSDVFSLIISYIANKLAKRKATPKYTFGFRRSEILAAFFNSTTLIILSIFIFYGAVERFINPGDIKSEMVIYLAIASIFVNAFSVLLIKKDAEDNMNIRSAYLHLFSDMMTSIAVLAGGLMMKYFGWYWVDPVISIIISLYLIYLSIDILKESLKIIMEFTPGDIDLETIVTEVENIEGIKNIHHLHIWQVNEHDIMLEAHIDLKNDVSITDFEQILDKIKTGLAVHNINHVTIQPEYNIDDNKDVISH